MSELTPFLDIFLSLHGAAWRLYVAPYSWCPPMLRDRLDDNLEAFPVAEPDLEELDRHMWAADAPYEKRLATTGGVEIRARGRSAVALLTWIEGLLPEG